MKHTGISGSLIVLILVFAAISFALMDSVQADEPHLPPQTQGSRAGAPKAIELGRNNDDIRESQEAYFNFQRRTKALSNAIVYLYAASVYLTDASESDKAGILFSQAKDLARYAQREYRVQLPLELRQNLGLLSDEEYRIQKERENLQSELNQLRGRMESIEQRLNQLNSR